MHAFDPPARRAPLALILATAFTAAGCGAAAPRPSAAEPAVAAPIEVAAAVDGVSAAAAPSPALSIDGAGQTTVHGSLRADGNLTVGNDLGVDGELLNLRVDREGCVRRVDADGFVTIALDDGCVAPSRVFEERCHTVLGQVISSSNDVAVRFRPADPGNELPGNCTKDQVRFLVQTNGGTAIGEGTVVRVFFIAVGR